ncbi:uncharacterized protein LOC126378185 [Pectinophora gossypiella]|uniref:MADF domain-containing protein n=1 Tax=Pectinophora gossypiella TaxID=13191 RepID=A0A1E1WMV5_PECGO|nr:uncharacterized protein LOC126378185 [Pectinophora gossypiella]
MFKVNPASQLKTHDLIELVKKRPQIWDKNCHEYKDRYSIKRAWVEICEEFVPQFNELKENVKKPILEMVTKKWNNVRDTYLKSLKNRTKKKCKPYIHANLLTFLDSNYYDLCDKSNALNQDDQSYIDNENQNSDMESEPYINEVFLDLDEGELSPNKIVKTAFANTSKENDCQNGTVSDEIAAIFSNLIEREEDEDRAFFNSITPTVKKLSSDAKLEFRIQVMTVLKNLKKGDSLKKEKDPIDDDDDD